MQKHENPARVGTVGVSAASACGGGGACVWIGVTFCYLLMNIYHVSQLTLSNALEENDEEKDTVKDTVI